MFIINVIFIGKILDKVIMFLVLFKWVFSMVKLVCGLFMI